MRPFQILQRHPRLLALLLGATATLGFAPFGAWPLPLLALAALFGLAVGGHWRRAALLGWLFGFAHFASGIYWVYISTHIYGGAPWWLGLLLAAVLFAYMALYPALVLAAAAALRLWNRPAGWIGVPALWLLAELLRGWVYTGFPWLSLGDVALDTPLQRLAPLVGAHGLSALLALLAWALYRLFAADGAGRRWALIALSSPFLVLLLPAAEDWTAPVGAPLPVAIVQGNIPQDQKWLPQMRQPTLDRYHDMTLAALDARLIVWPEAALTQPYDLVKESFLDPLAEQAAAHGATVLAGLLVATDDRRGYLNSMIAFGAVSGRYDKRHLVPFGEYFPIPDWLRPIMDVLDTPYSDLSFGAGQQAPVTVAGQRIGIAICFEDVFGNEFRAAARDAGLMASVTNDAWFGASGAAAQHLQIARMRALETGRMILRASNTGVSAVIGPDGALQAQAGFFTTEVLRAQAQPRQGVTPYVRWGDAPLWLLAAATILLLVLRRARG